MKDWRTIEEKEEEEIYGTEKFVKW
jgi:hypothetical protein